MRYVLSFWRLLRDRGSWSRGICSELGMWLALRYGSVRTSRILNCGFLTFWAISLRASRTGTLIINMIIRPNIMFEYYHWIEFINMLTIIDRYGFIVYRLIYNKRGKQFIFEFNILTFDAFINVQNDLNNPYVHFWTKSFF
jgi:hypothetical protein